MIYVSWIIGIIWIYICSDKPIFQNDIRNDMWELYIIRLRIMSISDSCNSDAHVQWLYFSRKNYTYSVEVSLYARLQTGRIIVWWCPSVRPGLRPPVFRTFLIYALTYWAEILHMTVLMYYRSSLSVVALRQFLKELCLFVNLEYRWVRPSVWLSVRPFSALFSYMLWHIELKLCTWLCFNVLQIKFECRRIVSIFEGVMPLCELRIYR